MKILNEDIRSEGLSSDDYLQASFKPFFIVFAVLAEQRPAV